MIVFFYFLVTVCPLHHLCYILKANCRVRCLGRSGATFRTVHAMGQMIAAQLPEIVVIHVSGNDIDCRSGSPPQAMGMAVFSFAKTLIAMGVKRVVISQVIRRDSWRHFSLEVGNARTASIKEFLLAAVMTTGSTDDGGIAIAQFSVKTDCISRL